MTTSEIATLADPSNVALPGYPVQSVLRRKVIPEFFDRVGLVGWRRMTEVVTIAQDSRYVDISASFRELRAVYYGTNKLTFIGDSDYKMAQALQVTTAAPPGSYWLEFNNPGVYNNNQVAGPLGPRKLVLGAPADAAYDLAVIGWRAPYFEDDTTDVNMNLYIPEQYLWGIVMGLRAEIYSDRNGIQDPTSMKATNDFNTYIMQAQALREVAIEATARYG